MVHVGVPTETLPHERRVALIPAGVKRLAAAVLQVTVLGGAGLAASGHDEAYAEAGAALVDGAAALYGAVALVVKVQPPTPDEAALVAPGATLVSLFQPGERPDLVAAWEERGVTSLSLERVPRITRAQSMDVLSSQATAAGYKAVLLGAGALGKFLPMLTTAAGTVAPAHAFVIGAGVAGLQAIATARRLGAVVSAFDVRAAAREQVQSLGAAFVAADLAAPGAEAAGGYARAQTDEERARTLDAVAAHVRTQDLVVATAQIPGRPAPRLLTAEMVAAMRPGSVIVDVAAPTGGNCELTVPGETVVTANDVTIIGPLNLPSTLPVHASQMLSANVVALLTHLVKEGELRLDPADEITAAMTVTRAGALAVR
jgi:NAD(P) transhydrogenase subunit alpha